MSACRRRPCEWIKAAGKWKAIRWEDVPAKAKAPKRIKLPNGSYLRGAQSPDELNLLDYLPLAYKCAKQWSRSMD